MNPGQMQCGKCGVPVDVMIGEPKILNLDTTTVIVVEHSGQTLCPGCSTCVRPAIAACAGFAMTMAPVPPQQQTKIIIPGGLTKQ
jgi:hypothetical protein